MAEAKLTGKYRPRVAAVTGWTIFFFVLLRVAIGWHFLYEGFWKVKEGTFSATPYLLASQGPLKPIFRWMVFDADGFQRMGANPSTDVINMDRQIDQIKQRSEQAVKFYAMTDKQKEAWQKFTDDQIAETQSLGLSADEIQKIKMAAGEHLHAVRILFGDTLGALSAASVGPKDPLSIATLKIMQTSVPELPVFDGEKLVGLVRGVDLQAATGQPATTSQPASSQPAVADKPVPSKVEDIMVKDNDQIKNFGQAINAADYQGAVESYKQLLTQVTYEEARSDPQYRAQRLDFNRKKVNTARNALLARAEKGFVLMEPVPALDEKEAKALEALKKAKKPFTEGTLGIALSPEQRAKGSIPPLYLSKFPGNKLNGLKVGRLVELRFPPKTLTFYIDLMMMFGLVAVGVCLILGLFTRFAAFCGVLMLAMFYFSMPPWPGTVDPPNVEGHYLFVNKNLIELIACLMIMSSHIGRWFGLDAFLGAISDRRRRKRAEREAITTAQGPRDRMYMPGDGRAVREPARV